MIKQDLLKVYAFAGAMWSSFKIPTNELDAKMFDEAWYLTLAPYPVSLILTAMQQYAKESDFCNVAKIGTICEKYIAINSGTYIDEEKALKNIRRAICGLGTKEERFEELTDFEKSVVGSPSQLGSWGMANAELFDTVIISNLRKTIKNKLEIRKFEDNLKIIQSLDVTNSQLLEGERSYGNEHTAN